MSQRKLIAEGKTSQIYLKDSYVYKVFSASYPSSWILKEVEINNEVRNNTKLCVVHNEFIKETNEIKMEYIEGKTLGDRIKKDKYKNALDDLIDLQLSIYKYKNLKLPNAKVSLRERIIDSKLEKEIKNKALIALDKIPSSNNLCHFDIHLLNIMFENQKYYIIDWVNAKNSHPILDIARTYVILKQYASRQSNKYLKLIIKKGGFDEELVTPAVTVMATLRLLDNDTNTFKSNLYELII
ncbi:phosphotransferase [Lactococcus lactis]|uniref:Phosphotransferase n=2 Tax=Lactococcus lactis TaxID=1358 RepID=A0AAE4NQY6_9LACT|nr:phosphotransferase [Lactococcus lactis]KST99274.1 putative aminoglycoside phosphotransferase (protein kinase related) diverged [Lactococcus lactis subsp. lactis]KSU03675.1 putative aminoglycoside phosphotransferase (protein kinase related) diverged [Lactococcus lactis subsp. lactis]MDV2632463.1 phosphotransferase [Lactococcus lactis]QOK50138.1 phosphotransferase [Lactococcus lactis]